VKFVIDYVHISYFDSGPS